MKTASRTWDWLGSRSAVRVVQVMVLVITATVIWLARQQSETVACNTRYNTANAAYNRDRSEAASQERLALDEALRALRDDFASAGPAIDRYLVARDEAERARSESPVLPPPADLCS